MNIAVLQNVQASGSRLVPSLRYRDVEAAIEWLGDAFGFQEHNVVSEVDGSIRHAQLTLGSDMIMLLPASPSDVDGPEGQRAETGGAETQSLYFVIDDAEAHYHRANAAGAEMLENGEYAFGGRGYSCRDPEGHVWHFGTFNPRQEESADRGAWIREFLYGKRAQSLAAHLRDHVNPPVIVAAVVAAVVAAATVGWVLFALPQTGTGARERGLAFKAMLAPQTEERGVRTLARPQLSIAPAQSASATAHTEETAARPVEQAGEPARHHSAALASVELPQPADQASDRALDAAERATDEVMGKVHAARQAADRAGEEALKRLRAAKKTATAEPAPAEGWQPANTAAPDARQQQLARERALKEAVAKEVAAKETAAKEASAREIAAREAAAAKEAARKKAAERTGTEARNWAAETERAKPESAQPAKAINRPPQGQDAAAQADWDCEPSPPSGQIVCHPPGKKPAAAKASPAAKQKLFAVEVKPEPSREGSQPAPQKQPQEQAASGQFWDCQPTPPDGQVICHPIKGR